MLHVIALISLVIRHPAFHLARIYFYISVNKTLLHQNLVQKTIRDVGDVLKSTGCRTIFINIYRIFLIIQLVSITNLALVR